MYIIIQKIIKTKSFKKFIFLSFIMKKLALLTLSLILIIFIAGCSQEPTTQSIIQEQTTTEQPEEIAKQPSEQLITFSSLKQIAESKNPLGKDVKLHGIGLKLHGVSIKDFFLFTDDERVMKNPSYMAYYGAEYDITVYNTPKVDFEQNLLNIDGKVVNCERASDGILCIEATNIEVVSPIISG